MSKKKQMPPKRNHTKLILILLAIVAVAIVGSIVGVQIYNHADHGKVMGDSTVSDYNTAITKAARAYNYITQQEFILIDTVSKELGKNTDVTFRVYQIPEGSDWTAWQGWKVSDGPANFPAEYVGNGTARLLYDSLDKIVINVAYFK